MFSLFRCCWPRAGHSPQLPAPAASSATTRRSTADAPTPGALSTSASPSPSQALLAARAVGPGVATLPVVAERAVAAAPGALFAVAALWLPLVLIEIVGTALVLFVTGGVLLLVKPASILLIKIGLAAATALIEVRLVALTRQILRVLISELLLVQILIEAWLAEVVGAVVAVEVVRVEVVPINVVGIDVVAIDVVEVCVVAVVVVVPVGECI